MSDNLVNDDLMQAATPEGAAFRRQGLQELEEELLAFEDWERPGDREEALDHFYAYAARQAELDADLLNGYQGN